MRFAKFQKKEGIFFKRIKKDSFFSRIRVEADSFAEAQQNVCDKMQSLNMPVVIIFPYREEDEDELLADFNE